MTSRRELLHSSGLGVRTMSTASCCSPKWSQFAEYCHFLRFLVLLGIVNPALCLTAQDRKTVFIWIIVTLVRLQKYPLLDGHRDIIQIYPPSHNGTNQNPQLSLFPGKRSRWEPRLSTAEIETEHLITWALDKSLTQAYEQNLSSGRFLNQIP